MPSRDELVVILVILHGATLDDYPTSGYEGMPRQGYSGSLSDQSLAIESSKRAVVHTVDALVKEGCCAVRSGVDFELGP